MNFEALESTHTAVAVLNQSQSTADTAGRVMPMASRLLYTLVALLMPLGARPTDHSRTHLFNPRWPPHAKFHTGQTLTMSLLLGAMTLIFAWRKTTARLSDVIAASAFAALYWVAQGLAIVYPGTAAIDPEFVTAHSYPGGIANQVYFEGRGPCSDRRCEVARVAPRRALVDSKSSLTHS